jgi:hypothetical protein
VAPFENAGKGTVGLIQLNAGRTSAYPKAFIIDFRCRRAAFGEKERALIGPAKGHCPFDQSRVKYFDRGISGFLSTGEVRLAPKSINYTPAENKVPAGLCRLPKESKLHSNRKRQRNKGPDVGLTRLIADEYKPGAPYPNPGQWRRPPLH